MNCIAATRIGAYLDALSEVDLPLGVYANAGHEDEGLGWAADEMSAASAYAKLAEDWVRKGVTVVGGCCGTGPTHIRALAAKFA